MAKSQETRPDGLATEMKGGMTPSHVDVIESANARGSMRHSTRGSKMIPDEGVLPKSGGGSLDKDGVDNEGYINKKDTPAGVNAFFNSLPPGMEIDDQELADIRKMPMLAYRGGHSYPGDSGFPIDESGIGE
jgi:hypothetical protein